MIALILAIALALCGCSPKIREGVIIDKRYDSAVYVPRFAKIGNVQLYQPVYISEKYLVLIKKDGVEEWVKTTREVWNEYGVGDYIKFNQ